MCGVRRGSQHRQRVHRINVRRHHAEEHRQSRWGTCQVVLLIYDGNTLIHCRLDEAVQQAKRENAARLQEEYEKLVEGLRK